MFNDIPSIRTFVGVILIISAGIYIYIREMTGADTPVITKVTKLLKKHYKNLYQEYDQTGYVKV